MVKDFIQICRVKIKLSAVSKGFEQAVNCMYGSLQKKSTTSYLDLYTKYFINWMEIGVLVHCIYTDLVNAFMRLIIV